MLRSLPLRENLAFVLGFGSLAAGQITPLPHVVRLRGERNGMFSTSDWGSSVFFRVIMFLFAHPYSYRSPRRVPEDDR